MENTWWRWENSNDSDDDQENSMMNVKPPLKMDNANSDKKFIEKLEKKKQ